MSRTSSLNREEFSKLSTSDSPRLIAACCGSIVTTWDSSNSIDDKSSNSYNKFSPFGEETCLIQDLAWNHNGNVIASCCDILQNAERQPNVALINSNSGASFDSFSSNIPKKTLSSSQSLKSAMSKCTSVSFGGKSRYLSISSTNGTVDVWDLKKKARVRQFLNSKTFHDGQSQKIPVSRASFDHTDTYVAVLSDSIHDSSLKIFNLRQSSLHSIHSTSTSHGGGSYMAFSSIQTNHAVVGTTDGTMLLWDISLGSKTTTQASQSLIASFENRHSNFITGLSFSPLNRLLLASSSLDGIIAFHDLNSNNTIQQIKPNIHQINTLSAGSITTTDTPVEITCLDLHADGFTCAAGTNTGHVFFYDLRKVSDEIPLSVNFIAPTNIHGINENNTHKVNSLQFYIPKSSSLSSSSSSSSAKISKPEAPKSALKKKLHSNGSTSSQIGVHFAKDPTQEGKEFTKLFGKDTSSRSSSQPLSPAPKTPQHLNTNDSFNNTSKSVSFHEQFAFLENFQRKTPSPKNQIKKKGSHKKSSSPTETRKSDFDFTSSQIDQNMSFSSQILPNAPTEKKNSIVEEDIPLKSIHNTSSIEIISKDIDHTSAIIESIEQQKNPISSLITNSNELESLDRQKYSGNDQVVLGTNHDIDGKLLVDKVRLFVSS